MTKTQGEIIRGTTMDLGDKSGGDKSGDDDDELPYEGGEKSGDDLFVSLLNV